MAVSPYTVRTPDGTAFRICLSDAEDDPLSVAIRAGHYPHAHSWPLYEAFLRPGMQVVDLGVHVGVFSLAAAAQGCRVLAVEANPRNVEQVRASIAANGFSTLNLLHRAVSDAPGEVSFVCQGPFGHVSSGPGGEQVRVPAAPLDALLAESGTGRVDFVKIDIEGSEVGAVRGMAGLLGGPAPPPVFYESNGHCLNFFGHTPRDLLGAFARHGYLSFRPDCDRRLLTPVGEADYQPECVADYLALPARAGSLPLLPPGLEGWEVGPSDTPDELLARFRHEVVHITDPTLVGHMVRELAVTPDYIRNDPVVAAFAAGHAA